MRMRDVAGVSRVDQGIRQSLGQADLTIDTTEQQRTEVGRQTAAVKIGANGMTWNGWKAELFCSRIHVGQGGVRVDDCVS